MDKSPVPHDAMRSKPLSKEDEYFLKQEMERQREAELRRAERETAEEKQRLKDLHYMRCPKCGHELLEEAHQGVLIDRCAVCHGLWLDAGELDQLVAQGRKEGFFKNFLSKVR